MHDTTVDAPNNVRVTPVAPHTSVYGYDWSPDGSRIVYVADEETRDIIELFTVMPDGTGHNKVNEDLQPFAFIAQFGWAPDGSRIAYITTQDTFDVFELYTALPDGTGMMKASGPVVSSGSVFEFSWSPDSTRLAYWGDLDTDSVIELRTVQPDGSGDVKVNGAMIANGDVEDVGWAPDASLIAYTADQDADEVFEVYVADALGSGSNKVSGPMVSNGDASISFGNELWAPDSSNLLYRADQFTDGVFDFFVADAGGKANPQISPASVQGGGTGTDGLWSADGSRIAYVYAEDAGPAELYLATPDGLGSEKISGPIVPGGSVEGTSLAWSR